MMTLLKNLFWGIFMAIGEVFPGVGMQTVAIIIGIYDDMISFLYEGTEFLKTLGIFIFGKAKKEEIITSFKAISWSFGIPLGTGLVITILIVSHTVSSLFETYPDQISAIAFGIVLASVLIPYKEISKKTWRELLIFVISFVIFYGLFTIRITEHVTAEPTLWTFFGGGLLASIAGFFPGISISFALLLMGLYQPLLTTIGNMTSRGADLHSFLALFLFLAGLGSGLLICVRLLAFLMRRYKTLFLAFIIGLILGSLRAIWPFTAHGEEVFPWQVTLPVFTQQASYVIGAFIIVYLARSLAERKGSVTSSFGFKEKISI
ncbi:DUF368 domain-containing protein [bacterium]|nr:DUF368 domain-containing protein [bacterium]